MKNLSLLSIIILLAATAGIYSCRNTKLYEFDGKVLSIPTSEGTYQLQAFNDHIIKLHLSIAEEKEQASHAVVLKPEEGIVKGVRQENNTVWMETDAMQVRITLNPIKIDFLKNGEILTSYTGGSLSDTLRTMQFSLEEGEKLYGAGERAVPLSRRGYRFELYNAPQYGYGMGAERLNYSLPVVTSSNKYTLFFDNPQRGAVDMGKTTPNQLEFSAIGGDMTCFVIAGEDQASLCEEYTALTGRQEIPPRWAFGYFMSRFGYKSQEQTENIYREMQEAGFPIDAVILDLFWFGPDIKGGLGNLDWYTPNWPNPEQMIEQFDKAGTKTVLITEPFVLEGTKHFGDAVDKKVLATNEQGEVFIDTSFYFGNAGLIDVFKPEAQEWFWEKYEKQIEKGVGGWWGDLGEPESHPQGMRHALGTADEVHNIYGHYWSEILWNKYQENNYGRLFNLNRSGWAGTQRFSIFPWTGDVSRSWSGFKAQLPLMLTMGMGGLGYIHSDLGGFTPAPKNSELYIRWMQMGVFNPIFRPHSSELPSEPIFYDSKTEAIIKDWVALRYAMLPYNYTLAYQNHTKGWPLARPLFFHYPNNPALETVDQAYLWGESLLVAPVMEEGQASMTQLLPEGYWFDFWTDELAEGGKPTTVELSLEKMPVWVKAGSIIPMSDIEGNLSTYNPASLNLHYYPHPSVEQSDYELYEDDGMHTNPVADDAFQLLVFSANNRANGLELTLYKRSEAGSYEGEPAERSITWVIHQASKPTRVAAGEDELSAVSNKEALQQQAAAYMWEKETQKLYVKLKWVTSELQVKIMP